MQYFPLLFAVIFLVSSVAGQQLQCVPDCTATSTAPNSGGPPCMCTQTNFPPGCSVSPCNPGDSSSGNRTCQCTSESKPVSCVNLRCNNGTEGYLTANSNSTSTNYNYGSNYYNYQYHYECGNQCYCEYQPPDCTASSGNPVDGAPACSCTPTFWTTGCTLKPCQVGDTADQNYFCECTAAFSPVFCYRTRCSQ